MGRIGKGTALDSPNGCHSSPHCSESNRLKLPSGSILGRDKPKLEPCSTLKPLEMSSMDNIIEPFSQCA